LERKKVYDSSGNNCKKEKIWMFFSKNQKGWFNPNQTWTPVPALIAWPTSKRTNPLSKNPRNAKSARIPAPTAVAQGPT
jgi:hypothetical protein